MSVFRKKNIIVFIVLLLIAGASAGFYFYNKGPVNIKNAAAQKTTAPELYSFFITDAVAAQKMYSGKIVMVSGIVAQVTLNQQGQQVILLKTSNSNGFINCTIEDKNALLVTEGQSIQLKGMCSGLGESDELLGIQPDLYLERCIVQP